MELNTGYYCIPNNTLFITADDIPPISVFEVWVFLNWNGNIYYRYFISNFGRLYDRHTRTLVRYSIDKDGYYMASVTLEGVGYKKIRLHRFELLSFYPVPDYMNLVSNHKDGNKRNLFIGNLEWTTSIENTRHGWNTGLNPNVGVNNGNGKYEEGFIRNICELIDQGYSNPQICDHFGVFTKEERMTLSATIGGIRTGKVHRRISAGYNFMENCSAPRQYDELFVHLVCNFLSDQSKDYTYKDIMDVLNIPNEERLYFKVFIDNLVSKRTSKNIVEMYPNIKRPRKCDNDYLMR